MVVKAMSSKVLASEKPSLSGWDIDQRDGAVNKSKGCQCSECLKGIIHLSRCAVHNEPAMQKGKCDCKPLTFPGGWSFRYCPEDKGWDTYENNQKLTKTSTPHLFHKSIMDEFDKVISALEDALFIVRLVNHSGAGKVVDKALDALGDRKKLTNG